MAYIYAGVVYRYTADKRLGMYGYTVETINLLVSKLP